MNGTPNKLLIDISVGAILKVVGVLLVLGFIFIVRDILMVVFVAVILAALIEPIVNRLEQRKIPRALAIAVIYVVLILFILLVARLVIPPMAEQVALLTQSFPGLWEKAMQNFNNFREFSIERGVLDNIEKGLQTVQQSLQTAAGGVLSFLQAVFRNLINFTLVLVLTFYLVLERGAMSKLAIALSPAQYHAYLTGLFQRIQRRTGDWARGQLILGVIVALLTFFGLLVIMPKYALTLALVAGLTELIPYLGPLLGAVPAVFLAFTLPPFSLTRGLAVLALYIVIQQVENNILVPKVMQKTVGLNPVVLIVVMLVGARLAGIVGIILAIPVATAAQVVIVDFLEKANIPSRSEVNETPKSGE